MNYARLIVTSAAVVAAIYAIGQSTSTSTSQSKNGGASASASSSSSSRGFGQGGSQMFGGQMLGGNGARPTHVVTYRFLDRAPSSNLTVRQLDAALYERENQFWGRLSQGGKLVMAGYWRERDGAMAILSARDDREAMQLLQSDPAIKQGAAYEIRAWDVTYINLGGNVVGGNSQNNTSENGSSQSSGQRSSSQQSSSSGGK